ncbi:EamA family transporter [Mycobacterium sp. 1465703.0]|uniref:EamA family transporter n=2 Tax=Mycobacterium sp. 1465703.0 TaxID=1834078 RepID=UPI0008010ABE|nr:EamA family transporter [Mycobacterium sp. 1465703.0]OBJ02764.1 hypothetical protein A5625_23120 [Mycobacterium sp. 1465703.0]
MVLLNATLAVSLYVRAINTHGVTAVAMLFAVIPAVAGMLSWIILDQRPDAGIAVGLVLGGLACWMNTRASSRSATKSTATAVTPQVELQCAPR